MNTSHNHARSKRIFAYRYSGARPGWFAKLLALSAVMAVIALLLLLALGLWVVFVVSAALIAIGGVIGALIPWRRRESRPTRGYIVDGEARRLEENEPSDER